MPLTKLLIIDDEVDYASALTERLVLRKFEAAVVYEAKDAQGAAEKIRPDVILLDLFMSGMDSKDMITTLKAIDPQVEIIIVSGHATPPEEIKQTVFDYIVKPIDIKVLIDKINKAMLKKKGVL